MTTAATPTTTSSMPSSASADRPGQPPPALQFGMLLFPGLTLLDLAGPQAALGMHGETHLVAKTLAPTRSDTGVTIQPTTTFVDCPRDLDVLFVPGGRGTADVMEDAETLAFLADRAATARYVTSVCTGSLILAAAGLLDGYRAATHWAAHDALAAFGVEVGTERVVVDRTRLTGGGVTAGIDFGLALLAALRGDAVAQQTQLAMEYDPAPPFDAGSREAAGPELAAFADALVRTMTARTLPIAEAARERRAAAARPGAVT